MIDNVTQPQCYRAFYRNTQECTRKCPKIHTTEYPPETPSNIKVGTFLGSAACALAAAFLIARKQSKVLNEKIGLFSIKYDEKSMLGVAGAALAGGLLTGIAIDDPKYKKAKIREGVHQLVANIITPLAMVSAFNWGYEKLTKNIKFPSFKETSKLNKFLNYSIKIVPNLAVTLVGLTAGVFLGTALSNKINDSYINNPCQKTERKVKPLDFIYHPDDVAAAFALADKQGSLRKIIGKIIPPIFTLHGYEAGTKR